MKIIKYLPFLLMVSPGFANAQVSAGTANVFEITSNTVKMVYFAWGSSAGGTCYDTTANYYSGKIVGMMTNPGTNAPTDDYDIELLDVDVNNQDVLAGGGLNRDTANTEFVAETSIGAVVNSRLALKVTNAGDSKGLLVDSCRVVIWIR